jgi:hypothetical protein
VQHGPLVPEAIFVNKYLFLLIIYLKNIGYGATTMVVVPYPFSSHSRMVESHEYGQSDRYR